MLDQAIDARQKAHLLIMCGFSELGQTGHP